MKYNWNLSLLWSEKIWQEKYEKLSESIKIANDKIESFLDNIDLFIDFINDYIKINEEIEINYC